MQKLFSLFVICLLVFSHQAYSKDSKPGFLVDKVIANIDNNIVLYSDIENQINLLSKDLEDNRDSRCYLVEQLVMNKIMTSQAVLDSIPLTDDEVDSELDRKINYYISMLGSKELFEQYYDKPIEVIKEDFRDDIRDQMLAQRMREKIVEGLTVTPTEVRDYYNKIPKDSLPFFNTEYEVSQVVFKVGVSEDQQKQAFDKILDLKKRVEDGEDFALLATLYSDDPGSAAEGGELGLMPRGSFVPEFEAAAFKLKDGEVSDIVKTQFGYHLIKLNKRIGEQIDCSHILIRAQSTNSDILKTQHKADSVRNEITKGNLSFFDAVKEYSDDDFSKGNGGRVLNYESGSTIMEPQQMDPALFKMVESLSVDSISQVEPYQMQDGTYAFRIAKLDSKVAPHQANLAQDYSKILDAAKDEKEQRLIKDWVLKRSKKSYIFISDEYKDCPKLQPWLSNE